MLLESLQTGHAYDQNDVHEYESQVYICSYCDSFQKRRLHEAKSTMNREVIPCLVS